ncbi:HNH endonuclease signature motif containing protein [Rhodococcus triatomae]
MSSNDATRDSHQVEQHLVTLDAAVERLLEAGLATLSDDAVVDTLQRLEVSLRKAAAVGNRLVIEAVERSIPGNLACRSVNEFLIHTLRISGGDAAARVKRARKTVVWHNLSGDELEPALPDTAAALTAGAIGTDHVRAIAQVMRKIPHGTDTDHIDVAEHILADAARATTPEDVTTIGLHLLAHLAADGNAPDERDRKRMRGLRVGKQGADLMTPISGLLDPEARALLEPVLAKLARPGMNNPDDPDSPVGDVDSADLDRVALAKAAARDTRTAVQRNHDALKTGLRHLLSSGVLGSHRGLPVTAIITLSVRQIEEENGIVTTASGGILPISDALRMAEKSHPVLALFDHRGRPLHLGRAKRLATADQRLALIASSGGCTRPGCDAPASMTAVHHVREWRDGGRTDIDNLDLACDHCHALIHDGPGGWQTRTSPDDTDNAGRTAWTAPKHIDPGQKPRINRRHHLDELIAGALEHARARREAELREHHRRRSGACGATGGWHRQARDSDGGDNDSDGDRGGDVP